MAEKYLLVGAIKNLIKQRIANLEVTEDKLISALETLIEHTELEGFAEVSKNLMAKVVLNVLMKYPAPRDLSAFYAKHVKANPAEMNALMVAVSLSIPDCTNCRYPRDKCEDRQILSLSAKPHVRLRFKNQKASVGTLFLS